MKWFIYLYPKSWRRRYGNELMEVLKQTDTSFSIVIDLILGIIDAWHIAFTERDIYGYRISQAFALITFINVCIVLKFKPLKESVLVEQVAGFAVVIAMLSLFLAIATFIVSLFKFGWKEGSSFKSKLTKTSFGLMGVYAVCMTTFIVLVN